MRDNEIMMNVAKRLNSISSIEVDHIHPLGSMNYTIVVCVNGRIYRYDTTMHDPFTLYSREEELFESLFKIIIRGQLHYNEVDFKRIDIQLDKVYVTTSNEAVFVYTYNQVLNITGHDNKCSKSYRAREVQQRRRTCVPYINRMMKKRR